MKSCLFFSQEKVEKVSPICSSETITLPFLIETILFNSSNETLINSTTTYDYTMWTKIPQLALQKNKNTFQNMNSYKQIITKSKIFSSEFSCQLYQSISMGKSEISFFEFKNFYKELDQIINTQRIFYYFNKCNEFVMFKNSFEDNLIKFNTLFKKALKTSNLILEYLIKKTQKIEDLKKDFLYLDYMRLVSDFKNSLIRNNNSLFFEGSENKCDKKYFLNYINNCKTFPLIYLFEYLRLEKITISFFFKEKTAKKGENKQKSKVKKFLMNEIKKTLKRCDLNGDSSCMCSFCKW